MSRSEQFLAVLEQLRAFSVQMTDVVRTMRGLVDQPEYRTDAGRILLKQWHSSFYDTFQPLNAEIRALKSDLERTSP